MRNNILLVFMIVCNVALSQNRQQFFSLRASTALANLYSTNISAKHYSPKGLSYEFGLSTYVIRSNKIGFIVEMSYAQKNIQGSAYGYSLNYLCLNLLPNFYFPKNETTLFLGWSGGVLPSYKVFNDTPKSEQYFKKFDFSIIAGLNHQIFTVHDFSIDLDSRFNLGLLNIREDFLSEKSHNYGFSLGILIKKNPKTKKI